MTYKMAPNSATRNNASTTPKKKIAGQLEIS